MIAWTPRPNQPTPIFWANLNRGSEESALDSETTIALICHLEHVFSNASGWTDLIHSLDALGFSLKFQDDRLTLTNDDSGISLCTCGYLGHSLSRLSRRFGKPRIRADNGCLIARSCPEGGPVKV